MLDLAAQVPSPIVRRGAICSLARGFVHTDGCEDTTDDCAGCVHESALLGKSKRTTSELPPASHFSFRS